MSKKYYFLVIITIGFHLPVCYAYQFYFFNKLGNEIEISANASRCEGSGSIKVMSAKHNLNNPLVVNNNCQEWNIDIKEIGSDNTVRINKPFYGNERYYWAVCRNSETKKFDLVLLSPTNRIKTVENVDVNTVVDFTVDEIKRFADSIPQRN